MRGIVVDKRGTKKMVNAKEIIEKIWWVIPPAVVVLFITIRRTFWEMMHFNRPLHSFASLYEKNTLALLHFHFFDFWGAIVTLSTIAFMSIGYYLSRKKSVAMRIAVPTITAIMGYYVSAVLISLLVFMY